MELNLGNNQIICFEAGAQAFCDQEVRVYLYGNPDLEYTWEEFCADGSGTCPTPEEVIGKMKGIIEELIDRVYINSNTGNGLLSELNNIQKKIDKGQYAVAIAMLQGEFIPHVQEFIDGGKIPPEEGQALIDFAYNLIEMLEEMTST